MAEIEAREIDDRAKWLEWRTEDVTASVGACLLGDIHPYTTAYQQWAYKSGLATPKPIDPKLARRGDVIEKVSPAIIEEERPGWLVTPSSHYYRDPDARIGATPDLIANRPDIEGMGNIQVKSVGPQTLRRWQDRDTGETSLPVWIAIQANIEASLMGATWAAVAAITIGDAGLDVEIIDVPLVPALMDKFREAAAEFWRRVFAKEPYDIDWGRDAAAVLDMYRDEDGSVIDLTGDDELDDILAQRETCKQIEREGAKAEKTRKIYDAQIINKLGNAATARTRYGLIKAPTVRVKETLRKAYSFRKLTVTDERTEHPSLSDSAA